MESLVFDELFPQLMDTADRQDAETFVARVAGQALGHAQQEQDRGGTEGVERWLDYLERRTPVEMWDADVTVGRALQVAWWASHGPEAPPPPNADPALREALGRPTDARTWRGELVQVGHTLERRLHGEVDGSPIARVELTGPAYAKSGIGARLAPVAGSAWIEGPPRPGVEIRTDQCTVWLGPLTKPQWAHAIGRDEFGLWGDLRFGPATYRMRWIPPGRFTMGSPDDEPGRRDNEGPQHAVTITRGYWLGEAPVTQALWGAVTDNNPSRFVDPERPVERVSWDDSNDELLRRLNDTVAADRGESFRLPTEAEWEYACRAGTDTATYAGTIEIFGQNNAPILDGIGWYGGNCGERLDLKDGHPTTGEFWKEQQYPSEQGGSRKVRQKAPNAWGLYDMLGNVWEWCLDGRRPYSSDAARDPVGPMGAGESRVSRGGSWNSSARGVRAAFRDADPPDLRHDDLGLRLARGQGVREDPGPEGEEAPEGP